MEELSGRDRTGEAGCISASRNLSVPTVQAWLHTMCNGGAPVPRSCNGRLHAIPDRPHMHGPYISGFGPREFSATLSKPCPVGGRKGARSGVLPYPWFSHDDIRRKGGKRTGIEGRKGDERTAENQGLYKMKYSESPDKRQSLINLFRCFIFRVC